MSNDLLDICDRLTQELDGLEFADPVAYVYNPYRYARAPLAEFIRRFGSGPKEALLLGMNPGPWGMAQTGVPFGEIAAVRDWIGINEPVGQPRAVHPKRPVQGFDCPRSEVSGRRLWGWAAERFGTAEAFFERFYVINYCPLIFLEGSGRNRTPNKLPIEERQPMNAACDRALRASIEVLRPQKLIGVGRYATDCLERVAGDMDLPIGMILHPSPASPAANRGWAPQAEKQLTEFGVELP